MPSAPENNMDPLLRACAQKRREEAGQPFEMPAATRRLLQAEVARTFPRTAESPAWLRLFFGFWPRLAFGAGLLAVLVIAVLTSLQTDKQSQESFKLARNLDQIQKAEPPARVEPSPAASVPSEGPRIEPGLERDVLRLDDRDSGTAKGPPGIAGGESARGAQTLAFKDDSAGKPLPLASPHAQASGDRFGIAGVTAAERAAHPEAGPPEMPNSATSSAPAPTLAASRLQLQSVAPAEEKATLGRKLESAPLTVAPYRSASRPVASGEASAAAASATVLMAKAPDAPALSVSNAAEPAYFQVQRASGLAEKESIGWPVQFSRIDSRTKYRANRNSPPDPNVLTTFQLQRQGNNVVVIDADGSVYEGTVQSLPQVASSAARGVARNTEASKAAQRLQTRFQADESKLKIQGVSASTAAAPPAEESFSFQAIGTNRSLNQKVVFTGDYQTLQNERIEGKASVGGKTEFPIEALRSVPGR
ncbi:MAG: hypothetical protein HY735_02410 [Verrucomicrobia bacterium]|nr:hypothetical protein [Verrucomicrobiota bacterium]